MTYKIIIKEIKPNASVPSFDVWVSSLDSSVLSEFPAAVGKSPMQIIQEENEVFEDSSTGFIARFDKVGENNLTNNYESIWETEDHYLKHTRSTVFDPMFGRYIEKPLTPGGYLKELYKTTFNIEYNEVFKSNI